MFLIKSVVSIRLIIKRRKLFILRKKKRRINEIIALQRKCSLRSNQKDIGKKFKVLIEGTSKKNKEELCGRTSSNKMCVFPANGNVYRTGDYADVEVLDCTSATLLCKLA